MRGELGRRIRRAFVARSDEYVLLAADYSQIELRLMAHLSGDEAMRRAFHESQDIHDFTARQIFNIAPAAGVNPNQRRMAKSVNSGCSTACQISASRSVWRSGARRPKR